MKIIKISFLLCFLAFSAYADDEKTYVFEAKGEFGEELKELIQKHSKDENVKINIYEKNQNVGDSRFLGTGINTNIKYTAEKGKKIFLEKCARCHGENGEKRAYGTSAKLKNIDAEAIAVRVAKYTSDFDFGGANKGLMQQIAAKTSSTEVGYVIAYLKGENSYIFKSSREKNTEIQTSPTEHGTYLK